MIRVAIALLGIFSGITIAVIFMLTNPPAVDKLSEDSLALIGMLTLIITVGLGCREVRNVFFGRKP